MAENDRGNFYEEYTCTNAFVVRPFNFTSRHITLIALGEDGVANTGNITISFDGTNTHDVLRPGESQVYDGKSRISVYVKDAGNSDKLRIKAW